jgi:hypothetical protein
MANRAQNFKHHDVRKALKAAAAAGVSDPTVRVVLPNGTEFHIGGAGAKPTATPVAAAVKPVAVVRKPAAAAVTRKPAVAVVRKPTAAVVSRPRGPR